MSLFQNHILISITHWILKLFRICFQNSRHFFVVSTSTCYKQLKLCISNIDRAYRPYDVHNRWVGDLWSVSIHFHLSYFFVSVSFANTSLRYTITDQFGILFEIHYESSVVGCPDKSNENESRFWVSVSLFDVFARNRISILTHKNNNETKKNWIRPISKYQNDNVIYAICCLWTISFMIRSRQ